MECYLVINRNEILIHATTWINLENVMLSESSQPQRSTQHMIPLTGNAQNREIQREKLKWWLTGVWRNDMRHDP